MLDVSSLKNNVVGVLGIPFDANSSFLSGPAKAPAAIRDALRSASSNMCSEDGRDLGESDAWIDLGDLGGEVNTVSFSEIEAEIKNVIDAGGRPLSLGGDHSITYPIIKSVAKRHSGITLLQFDAHPDLYDELDGNRMSHACPFARIMEEGLVDRLIQLGIRTMNPHQQAQADRFGVEVTTAAQFYHRSRPEITGPLYVSLDMDVFDPAFAPGVSHHEPGGLSSRDVIDVLQSIASQIGGSDIIGADIVELNPERDPSGLTAMLSSKLLKEILSLMIN